MFRAHQDLALPDDGTTLWRYMDFTKLVSLLETWTLFFPRLRDLDDPFEGHPPKRLVKHLLGPVAESTPIDDAASEYLKMFRMARSAIRVSCWHVSELESAAMWGFYRHVGATIAVRTTFKRFREAFARTSQEVFGSLVKYVDHETYVAGGTVNVFKWVTLKRRSFEHEREFRALVIDPQASGVSVPVDIHTLIERVFVSPTTPDWLASLVGSLLARYGVSAGVTRSELASGPDYYDPDGGPPR